MRCLRIAGAQTSREDARLNKLASAYSADCIEVNIFPIIRSIDSLHMKANETELVHRVPEALTVHTVFIGDAAESTFVTCHLCEKELERIPKGGDVEASDRSWYLCGPRAELQRQGTMGICRQASES